jgi:ribose transport system ATP-binding protein
MSHPTSHLSVPGALPAVALAADALAAERVLDVDGVTKRFPGVTALRRVAFDVRPGEVHVLFGENGAGKSTLVNIIAGTYAPDEGTVAVRGRAVERFSPEEARRAGVNAVFQDLSLVPTLTVAENLTLGREPGRAGFVNRGATARHAVAALRELDDAISPSARVDTLSRAQQQLVEVAKALLGDPAVLILDEPTTALTEREVDRLFEIVAGLKARGIGIIYITHRMKEIWRLGDRITVLRDGEWMATLNAGEVSEERLIELMTGRSVETLYPQARRSPGRPLLRLENVSGGGVLDASLEVRAGEIVGIAGLVGSGKSDIGRLCFGLEPVTGGRILAGEESRRSASPHDLLDRGVVYYPADRREEGLIPMRSVRENIVLSALGGPALSRRGMLRRRAERKAAEHAIARLRIQPPDPDRPVSQLSGGNQQKVVLARALLRDAQLHIFDEPTAGVDVGARVEVYEFIRQLCEGGRAVLLISSDLPEVVNLSHRVYVVHNGLVRAHLEGDAVTEENVLANFFDTADADRDGA